MTTRSYSFLFFIDTTTTEIYTLSLHDALPISARRRAAPRCHRAAAAARRRRGDPDGRGPRDGAAAAPADPPRAGRGQDRKSTRLNSSHSSISYAVFCLKKKKRSVWQRSG